MRLFLRCLAAWLTACPALVLAQLILPPGCVEAAPDSCAYSASPNYTTAVVDFALRDPSRANHLVPFRVRYPRGASGARPVVIWSHGGGTTNIVATPGGTPVSHGQTGSERRSESFARAGYIVIHIGRLPVETLSVAQSEECSRLGVVATETCKEFIGFHLYGPLNVAFIASVLPQYQLGMLPGFTGTPDRNRIAVGGWSGGSESAQNIAGAWQQWSGPAALGSVAPVRLNAVNVPGVVAFLNDAPRGPAWGSFSSGFQPDSLTSIDDRPFLFISGANDIGGDVDGVVVSRSSAFLSAARGNKYLAWSPTKADGGPNHATMAIEPDGCQTVSQQVHCNALESLSLAFLDALVERKPAAIAWLASDALRVHARQNIELHRR